MIDLPQMLDALAAFPDLPPGRQTLECSVMDLADDIAYFLHYVDDFHRSGLLQVFPASRKSRKMRGSECPSCLAELGWLSEPPAVIMVIIKCAKRVELAHTPLWPRNG